ncbi:energy-coupling factor transporter ATPase [Streptococcus entericus]|uniref:energy-coupling factor transporter ATPase n=1 Tax=Streptococcus entericus TaxID=155680 RepID=UPI0003802BFF|nr:energy-coupling factor transporter ATPase [Streptococcus entericus]
MIDLKQVYFKYDAQREDYALTNLSFHVKQGEWVSIIGHNGSGKSTAVRLIDGLLEAHSGEIRVAGQVLSEETIWAIRRKIAFVFQNPDNQFVGSTVEDDVAFGLENQGLSHEEMEKRVTEALDLVGMSAYRTKEPARLSGGQKQRVAIAGALALQPEIIILDEATSMLDPKGRLDLITLMKQLRTRSNLTVLSITHDLDEVALSDRVLVMKKGQLVLDTTPRELFAKGDELLDLGLDKPFSSQLAEALALDEQLGYLSEKELEDYLWGLHLGE